MKNKILYLVIGICCICFNACTHDSDEPEPVVKNELSRSTITVEKTVELTTPGTLQEKVEEALAGEDVSTLQKLTIKGPYNGKDVQYWKSTLTNLIEFNLKEAKPTQSVLGEGYEYLDPYGNTMYQNDNVIGPHSFSFMTNLEAIVFPDCVTTIEYEACNGCIKLSSVVFGTQNQYLNSQVFKNCTSLLEITIPSSVKSIGSEAFYECKYLNKVTLNEGLESIGWYAFRGVPITEITIPSSVKSIQSYTFYECKSLNKVTLNDGLESIDFQAFWGVPITEITIPSSVISIGSQAFDDCRTLNKVTLNEGLQSIGWCAFRGVPITEITIPSTVTELAYGAFENTQLSEITIPGTVTTVGGSLFNYCQSLCAIFWNSSVDVPYSNVQNSSCILCLENESIVYDSNWKNVAVNINGDYIAESLTLSEGGQRENQNNSYSIPKEIGSITVKNLKYERNFGEYDWLAAYWTYPGECSGWQTIVLPFTPTKIEHEDGRIIAPFNSDIEGAKPFWLRELTAEGFVDKTTIEPNKAYIIAMPNHDSYMDEYRLYGKIIFSAENVTLESTFDETTQAEKVYPASVGPEYDLQPTYNYVKHGPLIYALNVTYPINNHHYGSLFARSSSDVYAFEAYVKPGGRLARATFGIDTSSDNTRSAKEKNTTGIPQIGDM